MSRDFAEVIGRTRQFALVGVGVLLFAATMVYPALAVVIKACSSAEVASAWDALAPSSLGFSPTLIFRTAGLAAAAAGLAVILSLPAAHLAGRLRWGGVDASFAAVLLAPMLLPAMVYAFGWQRLVSVPDEARCVWVWASWSWPAPAALIGVGWARFGRRLFEEALLVVGPGRAFLYAVLPVLWRHILVSFLLLFAFFLGEYGVPHACGLMVYATQLLSAAESSSDPMDVVIASVPIAGMIVLALGAAAIVWSRRPVEETGFGHSTLPRGSWWRWAPVGLTAICILPPLWGIARVVPVADAMVTTVRTYSAEVVGSIAVALFSGVAAVFMGACLASVARLRTAALAWAVLWAALPGALVGEAVVTAYFPFALVYDHWSLMVIGYVARFGWIGVLVSWLAHESVGSNQLDAARVDGASAFTIAWRIVLASNWPTLLGGVFVVAALSLSEVATTSLVRVPSLDPVALILIEKFHRFEDGILVSLSLLMVGAALPGAVLAGLAARRWR